MTADAAIKKNYPKAPSLGSILNAAAALIRPYGKSEDVEIRRLGKAYVKRLAKLRSAAIHGKIDQQRARQRQLLRSPGTKLVALILSHPKCGKGRPKVSLQSLKKVAMEVDMFGPTGEPVRIRHIDKPDGCQRMVASFGRRSRAGQRLALDVMRTVWGDSEFEYARAGRGREAAIAQVLNGIDHRRVKCIAEADIKDFFPSISRAAVMQSGLLPKAVLKHHVLMDGMDVVLPHNHNSISTNSLRDGLWQGAISSAYVASKMIEPALEPLRERLGLIYIDNLTIGGATKDEVEVRLDTLASALSKHPAGGFQLRSVRVTRVGGNHDILGYKASHIAPHFGGRAKATPSRKAICRRERKLLAKLIPACWESYEEDTRAWAEAWPRQFPAWKTRNEAADLAELEAMLDVWPLARAIRKATVASKTKFRSFGELKVYCNTLARFHPEPLDWGAIENAVLTGDPDGIAASAVKNGRKISDESLVGAIEKIRPDRH